MYKIVVGDIILTMERDDDDIIVGCCGLRWPMTRADIRELQHDITTVMNELFPEAPWA